MSFVASTDGVRIFYTMAGEGEPFVLSHGMTHTWRSWENLGYVDALKDRYQLILIDTRGHGESDKPHDPGAYTMSQLADDVVVVLDDLGTERCHFWGHSLGARTGFHLLASHPNRISSLIAWGDHPYAVTPMEIEAIEHFREVLGAGMDGWVAMMDAVGSLAQYRDPTARREILLLADADAMLTICAAAAGESGVEDAISQMHAPCLLLAGEHEDVMDMDEARRAAAELPNADFVVVAGIGHTMCPSDLVLPYVLAFLERVRSGALSAATT